MSATRDPRKVVTVGHARYYGLELNDQSLTPGDNPPIGPTRLDEIRVEIDKNE